MILTVGSQWWRQHLGIFEKHRSCGSTSDKLNQEFWGKPRRSAASHLPPVILTLHLLSPHSFPCLPCSGNTQFLFLPAPPSSTNIPWLPTPCQV